MLTLFTSPVVFYPEWCQRVVRGFEKNKTIKSSFNYIILAARFFLLHEETGCIDLQRVYPTSARCFPSRLSAREFKSPPLDVAAARRSHHYLPPELRKLPRRPFAGFRLALSRLPTLNSSLPLSLPVFLRPFPTPLVRYNRVARARSAVCRLVAHLLLSLSHSLSPSLLIRV